MDVEYMVDASALFVRVLLLQLDLDKDDILTLCAENDLHLTTDELLDILAEYDLTLNVGGSIDVR
jgi:hypothetical protein